MKDKRHHMKHLQRKVLKSVKREGTYIDKERGPKTGKIVRLDFKRPKNLLNKRKIA